MSCQFLIKIQGRLYVYPNTIYVTKISDVHHNHATDFLCMVDFISGFLEKCDSYWECAGILIHHYHDTSPDTLGTTMDCFPDVLNVNFFYFHSVLLHLPTKTNHYNYIRYAQTTTEWSTDSGNNPTMCCSCQGQMSQNTLFKLPQGLYFFITFDSLHLIT